MFVPEMRLISYGANNETVEHVVYINGYHVSIREAKSKRRVYVRESDKDDWADASHSKIFGAIEALERALKEALKD